MRLGRQIGIAAALTVATFVGLGPLRGFWFQSIVELSSSPLPLAWLFEFAWAFVFGCALTAFLPPRLAVAWATLFGLGYGLLHLSFMQSHFSFEPTLLLRLQVYGQYFMPCLGGLLGALAYAAVTTRGSINAA